MSVTAEDIRSAATALQGHIIRSPMLAAPMLSRQFGCDLFVKLECQQYTSSFKARGAYIAMQSLNAAQRKAGVIAMSAGNHAQAVAYHAERMGIPAVIVMPAQTPFAKVARTRAYGAEVVLEGRNLNECEGTVNALIDERGLTLIHPYDNALVMTGQGTVGLEMLEDEPDLDMLVVPIGGGGLIGGIATIAREMRPNIKNHWGADRSLSDDATGHRWQGYRMRRRNAGRGNRRQKTRQCDAACGGPACRRYHFGQRTPA